MGGKTHYEALGVSRSASADDIRAAFRRIARECHPDRHPGDAARERRYRAAAAAYDVLSDPARRASYDRLLDAPPPKVPPPRREDRPRRATASEMEDVAEALRRAAGGAWATEPMTPGQKYKVRANPFSTAPYVKLTLGNKVVFGVQVFLKGRPRG